MQARRPINKHVRRKALPPRPAPRPKIDKREADPRAALAAVIGRGSESYAALSRMLGRWDGYLRRFVTDGEPAALRPDEHRRLADFFGLDERALGVRDLWAERHTCACPSTPRESVAR